MRKILLLLMIFSIISCKNKSRNYDDNSSYNSSYSENEDGYSDGTYCAEIEYYYSKTGTRSTYTLEVEIEDDELTVIHWPNGGWLDDSHFYPPNISDGYAEFESDRGVEYTVEIIGNESDCYLSNNVVSEEDFFSELETKKIDGIRGQVIWDSYQCDYVIIYTEDAWYVVAEKYSGAYLLSEGDIVRGELVTFGFEDVYNINSDETMSLYIDNYYATQSSAIELIREKCE